MGTSYSVMIESRAPGDDEDDPDDKGWRGAGFFNLGKTYEFARAFPHRDWPRDDKLGFRAYDVSRVSRVFYEKAFADTGLAWGTLEEVEAGYAKELLPYDDELRGAARAIHEINVRTAEKPILVGMPAIPPPPAPEDRESPPDWPIVQAVLAAARALRERGFEVRLLLWSD